MGCAQRESGLVTIRWNGGREQARGRLDRVEKRAAVLNPEAGVSEYTVYVDGRIYGVPKSGAFLKAHPPVFVGMAALKCPGILNCDVRAFDRVSSLVHNPDAETDYHSATSIRQLLEKADEQHYV